jgi:CDP-diacylglycerol--serine O-phosphatidyltransferase
LKKIAIIPTLLTLGNAVCGLAAIACAAKIGGSGSPLDGAPYFAWSGWLIVGAMIFDALDGYVARLSKSASDFGLQLDSLCDAISFGAAPAFLLLRLGPGWQPVPRLHQALAVIAALYLVCAILRLARFNIETTAPAKKVSLPVRLEGQPPVPAEANSQKRFRGLPSPGAAGCIASLAILRSSDQFQRWFAYDPELIRNALEIWATLGALIVALLMVSRIPYPHLTKQILRGRRPFRHVVQVIIAVCVIVLIWELALVLLFWLYALAMPLRYLWARALHRAAVPPRAGLDEIAPLGDR